MIDLAEIQSLTRSTIAAGTVVQPTFFEDADVVADAGNGKDTIEQRLNTRGFCVVVDLPINGDVTSRAPASTQCDVLIPVHVQMNVNQNSSSSGAGKNVLEIVDVVCSALLAYGTGADRYEHADPAFELVTNDQGAVAYVVWFKKPTVLAEVVNL